MSVEVLVLKWRPRFVRRPAHHVIYLHVHMSVLFVHVLGMAWHCGHPKSVAKAADVKQKSPTDRTSPPMTSVLTARCRRYMLASSGLRR